jgi:hypothetical protein
MIRGRVPAVNRRAVPQADPFSASEGVAALGFSVAGG